MPSKPAVSPGHGSLPATTPVATALYVLTGSIVLGYTIGIAIVGPSMYADQGTGFLILEAMKRGGPFNEMPVPDPADISRDMGFFVAWWSPGQYLVPGLFKALGFDLGQAITITVALCSALGLVGLHFLYRSWGFPPLSIAITLLVLAGARLFSHQFAYYGGGEIILFALTPWFLLLLFRMRAFSPGKALCIFAAIVVLTVAKLSGLVLAVASVAALQIVDLKSDRPGKVRRLVTAGVMLAVLGVAFRILWLSRGETPTTHALAIFSPERLLTHAIPAFVAGFTSILSIGDFATATLMHPKYGVGFVKTTSPFYLVLAIPVAFLAYFVGRQISRSHPDYFRFAAALTVIFALIMTAIFVRGGEVSLEDRHFRQIGLVLAIGVVHAVLGWRPPFRLAAGGLALVLLAYGATTFVVKLQRHIASGKSSQGFRHMVVSQQAMDFIQKNLTVPPNGTSLLVVPSAEVGLEFPNRRVVEIPANFRTHDDLRTRYSYRGRVDRLGVLVQTEDVESGKAALVLAAFKDYPLDGWTVTPLGNITYYSQGR
ncbi:MAG: hypothetical protein Q8N31_26530 [Reyranella sp.]|nr:hypothetical protein [Reyranella sp.]